jgi:hypothetical protein
MLSISVVIYRVIFIVEIKNNYKVIMVGKYSIKNTMVVEVYNYEKIYWRIDGNMPASSLEARNEQIIICIVGFVLCMAASGDGINSCTTKKYHSYKRLQTISWLIHADSYKIFFLKKDIILILN